MAIAILKNHEVNIIQLFLNYNVIVLSISDNVFKISYSLYRIQIVCLTLLKTILK